MEYSTEYMPEIHLIDLQKGLSHVESVVHDRYKAFKKKKLPTITTIEAQFNRSLYYYAEYITELLGRSQASISTLEKVQAILKMTNPTPQEKLNHISKKILHQRYDIPERTRNKILANYFGVIINEY